MLDAAYELFCSDGYRATTMDTIAERAGVAVQTLYFTFHTKDDLFQAVHERTVLGDDELPPQMQPWYVAAVDADDVRDAVRHICRGVLSISGRVAPMIPRSTPSPAIRPARCGNAASACASTAWSNSSPRLAKKAPLRKGVTKAHAADVLYLCLSPDLYWTMVLGRGWSERQLANWTERVILDDVFGLDAVT